MRVRYHAVGEKINLTICIVAGLKMFGVEKQFKAIVCKVNSKSSNVNSNKDWPADPGAFIYNLLFNFARSETTQKHGTD